MRKEVQYEWGIDSKGNLIHIDKVDIKEKKGNYPLFTCPNCNERIVPRKGKILTHHFGHHGIKCDLDNYIHSVCVKKIQKWFSDPYSSQISIKDQNAVLFRIQTPSDFISIPEYNLNGRRIDVMILEKETGTISFGFEVFHTHKLDNKKIQSIENSNIPIFEFHSEEIIQVMDGIKHIVIQVYRYWNYEREYILTGESLENELFSWLFNISYGNTLDLTNTTKKVLVLKGSFTWDACTIYVNPSDSTITSKIPNNTNNSYSIIFSTKNMTLKDIPHEGVFIYHCVKGTNLKFQFQYFKEEEQWEFTMDRYNKTLAKQGEWLYEQLKQRTDYMTQLREGTDELPREEQNHKTLPQLFDDKEEKNHISTPQFPEDEEKWDGLISNPLALRKKQVSSSKKNGFLRVKFDHEDVPLSFTEIKRSPLFKQQFEVVYQKWLYRRQTNPEIQIMYSHFFPEHLLPTIKEIIRLSELSSEEESYYREQIYGYSLSYIRERMPKEDKKETDNRFSTIKIIEIIHSTEKACLCGLTDEKGNKTYSIESQWVPLSILDNSRSLIGQYLPNWFVTKYCPQR